jgi:hypothetical protein
MKITHFFNKLGEMKVELADSFLVWQKLESLPSQFDALKTALNAQKNEWSLSEMTVAVSREDEVMRNGRSLAACVMTQGNFKKKFSKCNNRTNKPYKVKKFEKSSQQAGVGGYLS